MATGEQKFIVLSCRILRSPTNLTNFISGGLKSASVYLFSAVSPFIGLLVYYVNVVPLIEPCLASWKFPFSFGISIKTYAHAHAHTQTHRDTNTQTHTDTNRHTLSLSLSLFLSLSHTHAHTHTHTLM